MCWSASISWTSTPARQAVLSRFVAGEVLRFEELSSKVLKSVDQLHHIHLVQLRSYLRAAHLHLGLLLNFNSPTLTIKRVIVD